MKRLILILILLYRFHKFKLLIILNKTLNMLLPVSDVIYYLIKGIGTFSIK